MIYEEFVKEIGYTDKSKPRKIEYSPIDRLHYCPTCSHVVYVNELECFSCGQKLISPYKLD